MSEPMPKRHVVVREIRKELFELEIECTLEALTAMRKFLAYENGYSTTVHTIRVSALYDFDEIVAYITNWKPPTPPITCPC